MLNTLFELQIGERQSKCPQADGDAMRDDPPLTPDQWRAEHSRKGRALRFLNQPQDLQRRTASGSPLWNCPPGCQPWPDPPRGASRTQGLPVCEEQQERERRAESGRGGTGRGVKGSNLHYIFRSHGSHVVPPGRERRGKGDGRSTHLDPYIPHATII